MMWWGHGWWWILVVAICIVALSRMMGHGGHGGRAGHGGHEGHGGYSSDDPTERALANRLASGEIDVEEYERLREVIGRTESTHGGAR